LEINSFVALNEFSFYYIVFKIAVNMSKEKFFFPTRCFRVGAGVAGAGAASHYGFGFGSYLKAPALTLAQRK
jgi:hypothetical protein